MRTSAEIRRQLTHFQEKCTGEPTIRQTWAAALEWVLAENDTTIEPAPSPYADLVMAAIAARTALRSYQFGNSSPELAEEIADAVDGAIRRSLESRDSDLQRYSTQLAELHKLIEDVQQAEKNVPAHLPRFCADCGVLLMGGATQHAVGCDFRKMIDAAFKP